MSLSIFGKSARAAGALALFVAPRQADCGVLWSTGWSSTTVGDSYQGGVIDREVADDYDFTGTIERIIAQGTGPFCCGTTPVDGVWVRFYAWTSSGPGALLSEQYIPGTDPDFHYTALPQELDITLQQPYAATGLGFLSVQLDFQNFGYWTWWGANNGTPTIGPAYVIDHNAGGGWAIPDSSGTPILVDASVTIYGDDGSGPGGCGSWVESPTPAPGPDHNVIRDLAGLAVNDQWAVGEYNAVQGSVTSTFGFALHYDGSGWTQVNVPAPAAGPSSADFGLNAVAMVASGDVWAAGYKVIPHPVNGFVGSQIFVMHWNGSNWSEVPAPITPATATGARVEGIEVVAADDIWFFGAWVGNGLRPALAMHWNGSGFTLHDTPYLANPGHLLAAGFALSSDDIWAVGGDTAFGWSTFDYMLHWNGSDWSHVSSPSLGLGQRLIDIEGSGPNDIWATGEYIVSGAVLPMMVHWDGSSWTNVPTPAGGASLVVLAPDDVWSSGAGPFAHYDGQSWSQVQALACIPGAALGSMHAVSGELWAAGRKTGGGLKPLVVRQIPQVPPWNTSCIPAANSAGAGAVLSATGSTALSDNDFTLSVSGAVPGFSGIFFYGVEKSPLPFGEGWLCLGAPLARLLPVAPVDPLGQASQTVDLTAPPAGSGPAAITPGSTWNFQFWYRDPSGGPAGFNTSSGLRVSFCP